MRTTVLQFRLSRGPESLGQCRNNLPVLCGLINEATQVLLETATESGWYGTWQRMAFNVTGSDPYITLPRHVARLINLDVCNRPTAIQNEFFEFLEAGVGLQPNQCRCNYGEALDRGTFSTFKDLNNTGNLKTLRLYVTDQRDINKRVLIQAVDSNGSTLRSLDNGVDITGVYVRLQAPFVDTDFTLGANPLSKITGVQKDVTVGDVRLYEVDTVTSEQVALSVFEPSETVSGYRRYFLGDLPANCCPNGTTTQITALAKLDFVPVSVDQDYLLISNIPALKAGCEAVRMSEMDSPQAQQMANAKWALAIKRLNNQLAHYLGRSKIAVNFAPFGNDRPSLAIL